MTMRDGGRGRSRQGAADQKTMESPPPIPQDELFECLPSDTRRIAGGCMVARTIQKGREAVVEKVEIKAIEGNFPNAFLLFQKYLPSAKQLEQHKQLRLKLLKAWESQMGSKDVGKPAAEQADATRQRMTASLQQLKTSGWSVQHSEAEVTWRMVIGLGNPNALETGLTLHHLYGFPQIPGSAVKGLTRHYTLWSIGQKLGIEPLSYRQYQRHKPEGGRQKETPLELLERLLLTAGVDPETPEESRKLHEERERWLAELLKQDKAAVEAMKADADNPQPEGGGPPREKKPERRLARNAPVLFMTLEELDRGKGTWPGLDRDFRKVFGAESYQGEIEFFDAVPVNWSYKVDVMTPHYGDYYMNGEAPGDWMDPTPIPFLTLDKGSCFHFYLAAPPNRKTGQKGDAALVEKAMEWMVAALKEFGAGAKTRAGYGEMIITK